MKIVRHEENKYILRFERGEELIKQLQKFCRDQKIQAGYFSGIGAASEVVLSSFDIQKKEYRDKILTGDIETSGLIGNVSVLGSEIVIHAHGAFSDEKFRVYAGHVKKIVISVTGEIMLEKLAGKIERKLDQQTGLNLLG